MFVEVNNQWAGEEGY